jgi:hypothetical protein
MMVVNIPIRAADLAGTLSAMRDWLDNAHCTPVLFQTKGGEQPGAVTILVEFNDAADAEAFRRAFDASASDRVAA